MDSSRFYALAIVSTLLAIPFILEPSITARDHRTLLYEKQGKVVDASTGLGIPGVVLVASWVSHGNGAAGGWSTCQVRKIVTTDASGGYTLPDVSTEFQFERIWLRQLVSSLFLNRRPEVYYEWQLASFKLNYVSLADMRALRIENERGELRPHLSWRAPNVSNQKAPVQLKPLAMAPQLLNINDLFSYYAEILEHSACPEGHIGTNSFVEDIKREIEKNARIRICSASTGSIVKGMPLVQFISLIDGQKAFIQRLRKLTGKEKWSIDSQANAEDLCKALPLGA